MSFLDAVAPASSILSGFMQKKQQDRATNAVYNNQIEAIEKSKGLYSDEYNRLKTMFEPYVQQGMQANNAYGNLLGVNGFDNQNTAINGLKASSQYDHYNRAGQDAILQNASATGGLRGGNVQGALAQYAPDLLNRIIAQQLQGLSGLSSTGFNAASTIGQAGSNYASTIAGLYGNQADAAGNSAINKARANSDFVNTAEKAIMSAAKSYATGGLA